MKKCVTLILSLHTLVGCGPPLQPGIHLETYGDGGSVQKNQDNATQAEKSKNVPDIKILSDKDGFQLKYKTLGTVEVDYTKYINKDSLKNWFWSINYEEGWRNALCWPQAPLKLLTFGTWNFMPLAYPCYPSNYPLQEKDRQIGLINGLKKGAAAMGGNSIIMKSISDLKITTTSETSGALISENTLKAISRAAFVVKTTP